LAPGSCIYAEHGDVPARCLQNACKRKSIRTHRQTSRAAGPTGADFFKQAGYAPLTPDWPDDPETVEEARANPDVLAKTTLKQIADHTTEIINALDKRPAVMGHSTGGLLAQMLAGRGLSTIDHGWREVAQTALDFVRRFA
jgi:pimeloyl-ACP methyl ester carboxylesterase